MNTDKGIIDDDEGRRLQGVYLPELRCKCGNVLVGAKLTEGRGTCECGRHYNVDRQGSVAWVRPPRDDASKPPQDS